MMRARTKWLSAGLLGAGAVAGPLGCGDHATAPANTTGAGSIVSELVSTPTTGQMSAHGLAPDPSRAVTVVDGVVYVSVPPGRYPDGVTATIRNVTANTPASPAILVIAGGFDPVAVAAHRDDVLEVRVTNRRGSVSATFDRVPRRRPPRVVRTDPPKGRTDVAFSTAIVIVLSEPIAPSTVTAAAIRLERNGRAVSGRLTLSPDGLRIEFVPLTPLEPSTTYLLRVMPALTDLSGDPLEADEEVTFTTSAPLTPVPASAEIAFVSTRGGDTAIYIMSADGTGVTRVMAGSRAVWSPDGTRLAIVAPGQLDSQDIYIVEADGSGLTRFISGPHHEVDPAWSPDGRLIAYRRDYPLSPPGGFVGYRDGGGVIAIANVDGTGPPASLGGGSHPAWAPDGYRIAFTSMSGTWVEHAATPFVRCERLLVTDVDYTTVTPLTPEGDTTCATAPAWSPDGSRILFAMARVRGGSPESLSGFDLFPADLHWVRPDGTELTALLTSPAHDYAPVWSSDGSRIAFTTTHDGRAQIYVMNADGSGAVNISRNTYSDSYPSWRRRQ